MTNIAAERAQGPARAAPSRTGQALVAGFYVNWDETSKTSLRHNIDHLTHLIPEWLQLKPNGAEFEADVDGEVKQLAAAHGVPSSRSSTTTTTAGTPKPSMSWCATGASRISSSPA